MLTSLIFFMFRIVAYSLQRAILSASFGFFRPRRYHSTGKPFFHHRRHIRRFCNYTAVTVFWATGSTLNVGRGIFSSFGVGSHPTRRFISLSAYRIMVLSPFFQTTCVNVRSFSPMLRERRTCCVSSGRLCSALSRRE